MKKRRNLDRRLDSTVEQIRSRRLPEHEVEAISARVWTKLAAADPAALADADELRQIRSCDDYQALIPAFLAGSLTKSRHLLVESHTRECLLCRRVLNAARKGEQAASMTPTRSAARPPYARWAVAAALVASVGLGSYWAIDLKALSGQGAMVRASGGEVYRLASTDAAALSAGESIDYGERIRTAPGESALLELRDGSVVEIRERSWLSLRANRRGSTIDLERGSVIVRAAPQRDGHLYVATDDCLVSVTGTVFSVNHGTKGSRVSVIEGEVKVDAGGLETVLHPGDQTATHASLAMVPVSQDIAWSRDVDQYIELMREVSGLRRALAEEVPKPALRYSSRLMSMVPEDTTLFIALPNLAETISEADRILRERVAESRLLKQWIESREELRQFGPSFDDMTARLAEFGSYLGDEVIVTARIGSGDGEVGRPLVLAELRDAAGLRRFVEQTLAEHGGEMDGVLFLDDVGAAPTGEAELVVWMGDDTLVASDRIDTLRSALGKVSSGDSGFAATSFGKRVSEAYRDGAGVIIAADIEGVAAAKLTESELGEDRAALEASGLLAAQHFVMEQKWVGGKAQHRAVLGFDGPRQGIAAWLAEPAPMASLDFISPDAKFAAAVILVDPSVILTDLLRLGAREDGNFAAHLAEVEEQLGFDLRQDAAAAFGGEVALAVDGPLLPEPSWKVVIEVYDPQRAAWVLQQLVSVASQELVEIGKEPFELTSDEVGGRVFWSLAGERPFHMTFEDGFLIAAPNRGLLDRAIRYRQSGYTLASASRFRALLPTDGSDNFSAIFYQDAMGLLEPLAERIASQELTPEQRQAIDTLAKESGPTLGYAYGEPERVVFAASGTMSLLDAGLPGLLGMGEILDANGLLRSLTARDAGDDLGPEV